MNRNSLFALAAASALCLFVVLVGCGSPPTYREFFAEHRGRFPVTGQGLLLESLRVIALLEDYCAALENRDLKLLSECYSTRYFEREHDLNWRQERIAGSYFAPFEELETRFGPVEIEFVRKYSGYWLRQEDLDWLRSRRGEDSPSRSYQLTILGAPGSVELLLDGSAQFGGFTARDLSPPRPPGSKRESGRGALPVTVRSLVDSEVERPWGEVSFPLTIRGQLRTEGEAGELTSTLRERIVFLLEKEGGEWKIVSQF